MLGALIVDNGLEQLSGYQCLAKEIHHGNPLVKNVYCINLQRLGFRVSSLHKAAWPKSMSLMTNGFRLATITFSNLMSYHFTRSIHIQGAWLTYQRCPANHHNGPDVQHRDDGSAPQPSPAERLPAKVQSSPCISPLKHLINSQFEIGCILKSYTVTHSFVFLCSSTAQSPNCRSKNIPISTHSSRASRSLNGCLRRNISVKRSLHSSSCLGRVGKLNCEGTTMDLSKESGTFRAGEISWETVDSDETMNPVM